MTEREEDRSQWVADILDVTAGLEKAANELWEAERPRISMRNRYERIGQALARLEAATATLLSLMVPIEERIAEYGHLLSAVEQNTNSTKILSGHGEHARRSANKDDDSGSPGRGSPDEAD